MKTTHSYMVRLLAQLLIVLGALLASSSINAATLYWDGGSTNIAGNGDGASGGGNGVWNAATNNWDIGAVPHTNWIDGSDAWFAGTGVFGITNKVNVVVNTLTLGQSGSTNIFMSDFNFPTNRTITVTNVAINAGATLEMGNTAGTVANSGAMWVLAGNMAGASGSSLIFKGAYLRSDSITARSISVPVISIRQGDGVRPVVVGDVNGVNTGTITLTGTFDSDSTIRGFQVPGTNTAICVGSLTGGITVFGGGLLIWDGDITSGAMTISSGTTLQIGNNGTTGTLAPATAVNSGTLAFNRTDSSSCSASITGAGKVVKYGAGTLTLSSTTSSFSSGLIVSNGTVAVGNTSTSTTGPLGGNSNPVTVANSGTLDLGAYSFNYPTVGAVTLANGVITNGTLSGSSFAVQSGSVYATLTGSGALTMSGAGTVTLYAANTYSGGTTISNGTLALNGSATLGTNTINLVSNATLDVSAATSSTYTLGSGQTLTGGGSVVGSLAGTTFGGASTIAPGGAGAFGTLSISGNLTLGGNLNFDLSNLTGIGGGTNDLIQMSGGILGGTCDLYLSGNYANGTYTLIQGVGTMSVTPSSFTVHPNVRGAYTIDTTSVSGSVLLVISGMSSGTPVVWQGNVNNNWDAGLNQNWTNAAGSPDYFYNGDAARFDDTAGLNTSVNLTAALSPDSVSVNSSSNYFFGGAGKITGTSGITKDGTGTLTVSNANDFTGNVTINNGIFRLANATACGATNVPTIVNSGGTFDLNGIAFNTKDAVTICGNGLGSTGAVINTGAEVQNAIRSLTLGANSSVGTWGSRWDVRGLSAFSGELNLNGFTYTKMGGATNYLVDAMVTNTGSVIVQGGALGIARSWVTNTGTISMGASILTISASAGGQAINGDITKPISFNAGGTLQLVSAQTYGFNAPVTNNGTITVDVASGGTLVLSNTLTGAGGLTKTSTGTNVLNAASPYAGNTIISAGTLALGPSGSIASTPDINLAGGAFFDPSAAGDYALAGGRSLSGGGSSDGTVKGSVTMSASSSLVPGGMGAYGTLLIGSNLTMNGGTCYFDLSHSTNMGAGANDLIKVGTNLTVNSTIALDISGYPTNGAYVVISNVAGTRTGNTFSFVNHTRASLSLDTSSNKKVVVGVTQGTPVTLVWKGDGANNLWDVATTANWVSNSVIGQIYYQGDNVIFDDSGSYSPNVNLTTALFPTSVTVSNTSGTITLSGSGSIQGPATLTKVNGSTLLITNSQPYTGLTTISGGTLQIGNGTNTGALSGNGAITNSGTLTFYRSDTPTIANAISGTGTNNFVGTGGITTGAFQLSGNNTNFTGIINLTNARINDVSGGSVNWLGGPGVTINVPSGSGVGAGFFTKNTFNQTINIAGTGWVEAGTYGALRLALASIWAGSINLTANARIGLWSSASGVVTGPISGSYQLELWGANGTCTLTNAASANSTTSTLIDGTNLVVVAGSTTAFSTGRLLMDATTTLKLNGNNTAFASITNLGGLPQIQNGHASTAATLTVGGDNSSTAFSGPLVNGSTAALNITKMGSGTLTLGGTNTYTGSTTISNGTLALAASALQTNNTTITVAPGAVFDISANSYTLNPGKTLNAGRNSGFATDINGSLTSSGTIQPGANGLARTMTIAGGLTLNGGTLNFDLSNTNVLAGATNDQITASGALNLSGTTTINVNWLGGGLPSPGTYTLINAGSLGSGTTANFALGTGVTTGGRSSFTLDMTTTPGTVYLTVVGVPLTEIWTNAVNNVWDNGVTGNWLTNGALGTFFSGDYGIFNDTPTTDQTINIVSNMTAGGLTFSNNVRAYTFTNTAPGYISATALNKIGTAAVTVAAPLDVTGTMVLSNGITFAPPAGSSNVLSGSVSGSGALTMTGNGQLVLSGANTAYPGPLTLARGSLLANNNNALGTGTLTIGSSLTGPTDTNVLTINTGITVTNPVVVTTNATNVIIYGPGQFGGPASFTMNGSGYYILGASATNITGSCVLEGGTLQFGDDWGVSTYPSDGTGIGAFGPNATLTLGTTNTGANTTRVRFRFANTGSTDFPVSSTPIIVSSNAPNSMAILELWPAANHSIAIQGKITLQNRDIYITNYSTPNIDITCPIAGQGNVHFQCGAGNARYGNVANTNFGDIYVDSGSIQTLLMTDGNTNANVYMAAGTHFSPGFATRIGGLFGGAPSSPLAAAYINQGSGSANTVILTVGCNNTNATFYGNMQDNGTSLLSLSKIGTGTQTLNGNCSFTGATAVSGGTLIINSNYASVITVATNAILGGTGVINTNVTISAGGTLSPGNSIGTLTISNNLTLTGNQYVEVDKGAVQTNDYVYVGGTLTGSGAGTITLTNVNPGLPYALALGDKFTLFNKPVTGGSAKSITSPSLGAGLGWGNRLAIDGSVVVISTVPTNITFSVTGSLLTLSWPADHQGWHLQCQTNTLAVGLTTNTWVTIPGSEAINSTNITINPTNPTVFYRMVYP